MLPSETRCCSGGGRGHDKGRRRARQLGMRTDRTSQRVSHPGKPETQRGELAMIASGDTASTVSSPGAGGPFGGSSAGADELSSTSVQACGSRVAVRKRRSKGESLEARELGNHRVLMKTRQLQRLARGIFFVETSHASVWRAPAK